MLTWSFFYPDYDTPKTTATKLKFVAEILYHLGFLQRIPQWIYPMAKSVM